MKTVMKMSVFPAEVHVIWEKLQRLSSLQYIASPYASFRPVEGKGALIWREGEFFSLHFRLFRVIPLGVHTIRIITFDQKNFTIVSNESNRHVPVWNHRIILESIDVRHKKYTDQVEIEAGWKTLIVYAWAKRFYTHRQRKWIRLLKSESV